MPAAEGFILSIGAKVLTMFQHKRLDPIGQAFSCYFVHSSNTGNS